MAPRAPKVKKDLKGFAFVFQKIKVFFLCIFAMAFLVFLLFQTGTVQIKCKICGESGKCLGYQDVSRDHNVVSKNPLSGKKYEGGSFTAETPKGVCKCGHTFKDHVKINSF